MGKEAGITVTRQRTAQEERRLQAIRTMNNIINAAMVIAESFAGEGASEELKEARHESNRLALMLERDLASKNAYHPPFQPGGVVSPKTFKSPFISAQESVIKRGVLGLKHHPISVRDKKQK